MGKGLRSVDLPSNSVTEASSHPEASLHQGLTPVCYSAHFQHIQAL